MTPVERYAAKAMYHVGEAEAWQKRVSAMEDAAEQQAKASQRPVGGRATPLSYAVSQILLDNNEYKRAVAIRNGHQTRAQMYAATAQAAYCAAMVNGGFAAAIPNPRTAQEDK